MMIFGDVVVGNGQIASWVAGVAGVGVLRVLIIEHSIVVIGYLSRRFLELLREVQMNHSRVPD